MNGIIYKAESRIPDLALLLVGVVACGSFALSYSNLVRAAILAGIPEHLAPLFPLTIDSFLAIGSIVILRQSLRREDVRNGWIVLVTFTGVSVAINIAVADSSILSIVCHALPPCTLACSLELFTSFIRSDLTRDQTSSTHADQAPEQSTGDVCTDAQPMHHHELSDANPAQVMQHECTPDDAESTAARIMRHYYAHPGCSISTMADALGLHRSTVSRHMRALTATGMIQGHDGS